MWLFVTHESICYARQYLYIFIPTQILLFTSNYMYTHRLYSSYAPTDYILRMHHICLFSIDTPCMTKINELLYPRSIFKQIINKIDPKILIRDGVKEKLSQCAVLTTSFLGALSSIKTNKIDTTNINNVLEGMGIKETIEKKV